MEASNSEALFGPGCPWYDMNQQFGDANVKWCEERLCTWFNEPANTWSNLGYMILALLILWQGGRDSDSLQQKTARIYGVALFICGAFSFWYHASNNYLTQVFDFVGMFIWAGFLVVSNLRRMGSITQQRFVPVYVGLILVCTALVPVCRAIGVPYQLLVVLLGIVIAITEAMASRRNTGPAFSHRWFYLGLVTIVIAEGFSILDLKRVLCMPQNHIIQGHAIWHIIASVGIYFVYLFYRQFRASAAA